MKYIKSYKLFESFKEDLVDSLSEDNRELKSDVLELIENTIQTDSKEALKEFIESYLKDSSKIEGFINDADIYDFYLKYSDSIDAILESIDYFSRVPKEDNIFGVYQYVIESTKQSMIKILKEIRFDIFNIKEESDLEEVKESIFDIFNRNPVNGCKLVAVDSPVRDKWNKKVTFIYALTSDVRALFIGEIRNTQIYKIEFVPRVIKRTSTDKTNLEKVYAWEEIHKYRDLTTDEKELVKPKLQTRIWVSKENERGVFITKEEEITKITKMPITWK